MENSQNAVAQLIKKLGTDKCQLYTQLNSDAVKGQIVLAGDSLIENFMIPELYHGDKIIYNRGIAGNSTYDILERLETTIIPLQPSKIFLLAGTNDFMPHIPDNDELSISKRIIKICDTLKNTLGDCTIYVISLFPVNLSNDPIIYRDWLIGKTNEKVQRVNLHLSKLCGERNYSYINAFSSLQDKNGQLDISFTLDGTHLNIEGYKILLNLLSKFF